MELDLWNDDFQLAREWGLDIPVPVSGGQFGDLKSTSHPAGDTMTAEFQDGSQILHSVEDDGLGMEWMESTDIGSFLESLGVAQTTPLEDSLNVLSPAESFKQTSDSAVVGESLEYPELSGAVSELHSDASQAQVCIVPCEVSDDNVIISGDMIIQELSAEDFSFSDLDIVSFDESTVGSVSEVDIVGSPVAEVESTISFSGPSSPETSTVITSSPELYKVICSTTHESKNVSSRSSSKTSAVTKKVSKVGSKRKPAEPVPEHIIQGKVNKKDRKKLQNKNAAIRYRMKKREEAQSIMGEEQELEAVNLELKTKVDDLEREIRYMKNLMGDIIKAKGISI